MYCTLPTGMIMMMMLKVRGCFRTSKSNFETICLAFMVTIDVADFGKSERATLKSVTFLVMARTWVDIECVGVASMAHRWRGVRRVHAIEQIYHEDGVDVDATTSTPARTARTFLWRSRNAVKMTTK